jgi:heme O synthase-like polyprenyltransferase
MFIWLLAAGVSSLLIPLFGFLNSFFFYLLLVAAAFWLFGNTIIFLRSGDDKDSLKATFMKLNIYAVLVLSLLSVDRLLSS